MKVRHRTTGSESDADLYQYLTLTYGDSEKDAVAAALSARTAEDLDGNRSVRGYYPFGSLDDKYRSFATQRVVTAYLDLRSASGGLSLRAGRQFLEEFPEAVSMDGATFRVRPAETVSLTVFGGLPVNPFEASIGGDAMYGAGAEWMPDAQGRYRLEYLHVRDENVFGLHQDDLLAVSMDEAAGEFRFHARYTMLEGESRDLVARLAGAVPDAGLRLQLQGAYVFHRIEVLSFALDPYASFLMELEPYVDLAARISKSFGEPVSIDASFTLRRLARGAAESTYNHEFKRVEITPQVRPLDDLSLRVSADYWNSSGRDFWTIAGDLQWSLHRDIAVSFGSSYALYAVDAFSGEERERVRTFVVGAKWTVSKGSFIEARCSLERTTIGSFRVLEFGVRHVF